MNSGFWESAHNFHLSPESRTGSGGALGTIDTADRKTRVSQNFHITYKIRALLLTFSSDLPRII